MLDSRVGVLASISLLYTQWHYPTFNTRHTSLNFGHVMDPSNPSLNHQFYRLGCPPTVLSSDMLPVRSDAHKSDWTKFHNWDQISQLSKAFNYALMGGSSIVLLVGRASFNTFDAYLRRDQSLHLTKVPIYMPKVFKKQPFFMQCRRRRHPRSSN
ncbi:hypothetical protein GGI35DRAFT_430437 [Trichoderma velutinum]